MKTTFTLATFILISILSFGQKSIILKTDVKPNKEYTTKNTTITKGEIEVVADEEVLEKLKDQGIESSIISESLMDISTIITTLNEDDNGEIPAVMEYKEMSVTTTTNGESTTQILPFSGSKAIGKYDVDHNFSIDSIIGGQVTKEMEEILNSTLTTIQQSIDFPKEALKKGDSFTLNLPMSIPIQGMQPFNLNIITNYILQKVKGGVAYLEFTQTVELDIKQEGMEITASGTGTGTSEFDLEEEYLVKYTSNLPVNMTMKINERMTMKMKMTSISTQTVEIK